MEQPEYLDYTLPLTITYAPQIGTVHWTETTLAQEGHLLVETAEGRKLRVRPENLRFRDWPDLRLTRCETCDGEGGYSPDLSRQNDTECPACLTAGVTVA